MLYNSVFSLVFSYLSAWWSPVGKTSRPFALCLTSFVCYMNSIIIYFQYVLCLGMRNNCPSSTPRCCCLSSYSADLHGFEQLGLPLSSSFTASSVLVFSGVCSFNANCNHLSMSLLSLTFTFNYSLFSNIFSVLFLPNLCCITLSSR